MLILAFFVNAVLIGEKIVRMAKAAIAAEEGGTPIADGDRLPAGRGLLLVAINAVLFAAIIADMVLKPF